MNNILRRSIHAVVVLFFAVMAPAAWAVMPDEVLSDPGLEARARALSLELRCLVCQNQSIDDSSAPLARDLRLVVRERLLAGDSDAEVITYLSNRFGSFVLLKPPFNAETLPLWLGPGVILLLAGGTFVFYLRRRPSAPETLPPQLTGDEIRQLAVLNSEVAS